MAAKIGASTSHPCLDCCRGFGVIFPPGLEISWFASPEVVASSSLQIKQPHDPVFFFPPSSKEEQCSDVSDDDGAAVEAAAGDGGRDGDADSLQRAARRLLLHGGQSRRDALPRLHAHAPGLQRRLRRHGKEAPLLRPRLWDAQRPLVEDLRQGLLRQGKAGYEYDDGTFEQIFGTIYSVFGTSAPYSVFPDAQPFLRWLRDERKIMVGIISNADCRYRDLVLPALGLNQRSEWDFGVFSGVVGVEKPDRRIYEMALEAAGGVAPEEALHIGDSMSKDYVPARGVGMHALLLDRFGTADAERWRRSGAPVLPDLASAREWLAGRGPSCSRGGSENG